MSIDVQRIRKHRCQSGGVVASFGDPRKSKRAGASNHNQAVKATNKSKLRQQSRQQSSHKPKLNEPNFIIGLHETTNNSSARQMVRKSGDISDASSFGLRPKRRKLQINAGLSKIVMTHTENADNLDTENADNLDAQNADNLDIDSFDSLSFDNFGYYKEINGDQSITTLQQAIAESEYPHYKLEEIDNVMYINALICEDYIYRMGNGKDWMIFHRFDEIKKKFVEDQIINVTKLNGIWSCDKRCTVFNARKYANDLDENDKTPLCIHGMLCHLILDCDNPTNLGVIHIKEEQQLNKTPVIYWLRRITSGARHWMFVLDRLGVKHTLWLNNNGKLKCDKHKANARQSRKGSNKDRGGCICTKDLDEALKREFGTNEYEILRGKGQYERLVQVGKSTFNEDLLHSKETVPVPLTLLTPYDKNRETEKYKKYHVYIQPDSPPELLYPEVLHCTEQHCQASFEDSGCRKYYSDALLHDVHRSCSVQVLYWKCKCGKEYHYDGLYQHIFNYKDEYLLTHELVLDVTRYMTSGRCKTFTGYRTQINDRYMNRGCKEFMNTQKLIELWQHSIVKFEWFERLRCFACDPNGTNNYKVNLWDGTDVRFSQIYCDDLFTPRTSDTRHDKIVKMKYLKSTRFIDNVKIRKLLERKIVTQFGARGIDKREVSQKLNPKEIKTLNVYLRKPQNLALKQFLIWVEQIQEMSKDDEGYESLIYALIPLMRHAFGPVSVLQLAHPKLIDDFVNFDGIDWTEQKQMLFINKCPLFHSIIQSMINVYGSFDNLPSEFVNFIKAIGDRASLIRTETRNNRYKETNPTIDDVPASEEDQLRFDDYFKSGSAYSGKLLRYRLKYSIDSKRDYYDDTRCNKTYVQRTRMTSAVMISRCAHRIATGVHVCRNGESVDDVISAVTCTMEKAPEHILYDNACKLSDSARLREYDFFENTAFSGDEPHSKGHLCGRFFNVYSYKHSNGFMKNINCGGCEQGNNLLLSIRLAGTFMSMKLLMLVLRISMEWDNRKLLRSKSL